MKRKSPIREFKLTNVRSSGPGGQNVNKVSSKVILEWDLLQTDAFSEDEIQRIKSLAMKGGYFTKDGRIMMADQTTRSQMLNKQNVLHRLDMLIGEALLPRKGRIKTKIPRRVKAKRVDDKKKRSGTKAMRRSVKD